MQSMTERPYQLFDALPPEQYQALKVDIAERGVLVPVEVDEDGEILDGHNRFKIAAELGVDCPTIVRSGMSEDEKREHVLKLNLLRRHMDNVEWGRAFRQLLEERGIQSGRGKVNQHTRASATVAEASEELGVPERTARRRVELADAVEEHPDLAGDLDAGNKSETQVRKEAARREAECMQDETDRAVGKFFKNNPEAKRRVDLATARLRLSEAIGAIGEVTDMDVQFALEATGDDLHIRNVAHAHRELGEWLDRVHRAESGLHVIEGGANHG